MSFSDEINIIRTRILEKVKYIKTEEATKDSLIRPLLVALGYDVSDPTEIVPEFNCDFGTKKGEKVDFAILKNGNPYIIIECKHCKSDLGMVDLSQLHRYFTVTDAKLAILTNGRIYKFYTDTQKANIMDQTPFLDIDLVTLNDNDLAELKKFSKNLFNMDDIFSSAAEAKQIAGIVEYLKNQLDSPSDDFVRFLVNKLNLYSGKMTEKVIKQFIPIFKAAHNKLIAELATDRIELTQGHKEEENDALEDEDTPAVKISGTKPEKFIFLGETILVKSWIELLQKFTSQIYKYNTDSFSKIFSISGKKRTYFTDNPKILVRPVQIENSCYFIEGNLSSRRIIILCNRMLKTFGYSEADLEYKFK